MFIDYSSKIKIQTFFVCRNKVKIYLVHYLPIPYRNLKRFLFYEVKQKKFSNIIKNKRHIPIDRKQTNYFIDFSKLISTISVQMQKTRFK